MFAVANAVELTAVSHTVSCLICIIRSLHKSALCWYFFTSYWWYNCIVLPVFNYLLLVDCCQFLFSKNSVITITGEVGAKLEDQEKLGILHSKV